MDSEFSWIAEGCENVFFVFDVSSVTGRGAVAVMQGNDDSQRAQINYLLCSNVNNLRRRGRSWADRML